MAAVTVVTTTFKRPELLRKALESLRAQTFSSFEVFVCDNDNDPGVAELVASFGDTRFRYIGRPENLGLMRNAIEGFRAVTTEYTVKLDDDDEFDPQFLELTVGVLEKNPDAVLSFGSLRYIGPDGDLLPDYQQMQDGFREKPPAGLHRPFLDLVLNGAISLNAAVVRTRSIPWSDLKTDTDTAFDLHILLEAAGDDSAACHVPEASVRYRVHPGSDTSQRLARLLESRLACLTHALESTKAYNHASLERHRDIASVQLAREYVRKGDQDAARRTLRSLRGSRLRLELLGLTTLAYLPTPLARRLSQWRLRRWQGSIATGATSD